jgi:hypothetical protein
MIFFQLRVRFSGVSVWLSSSCLPPGRSESGEKAAIHLPIRALPPNIPGSKLSAPKEIKRRELMPHFDGIMVRMVPDYLVAKEFFEMTNWLEKIKPKLTKKLIFRLFLIAVFFPHLWAFISGMRAINNIAKAFDLWYFLRYFGYVLGFTLLESVLYFAGLLIFSLLLPRRWSRLQTFSLIGVWSLLLPVSVIATKVYFTSPNARAWIGLEVYYHPGLTYFFYGVLWVIVVAAFALPAILISRSEKTAIKFSDLLEKIETLSKFYLALDLVGFVAIIGRLISV